MTFITNAHFKIHELFWPRNATKYLLLAIVATRHICTPLDLQQIVLVGGLMITVEHQLHFILHLDGNLSAHLVRHPALAYAAIIRVPT